MSVRSVELFDIYTYICYGKAAAKLWRNKQEYQLKFLKDFNVMQIENIKIDSYNMYIESR